MERSSVAQVAQIGLETTPGTAVAATRRLGSLTISPGIQDESSMFRPAGVKFATVGVQNREWMEGDVEGSPTYEEVIIPLSGAIDAATVTQLLDGGTPTGAYEWVFTPDSLNADNPKTFTLEQGQAGVQAERFTHLLFTAFGMEISRGEVTLSGSCFGKRAQLDATITAGLDVPVDLTPITPGSFSVYLADTHEDLESAPGVSDAAKRAGRIISANPSIEDRYNPAWFVNAAEESFTTFVENADGVGGETGLTLEADAYAKTYLEKLRSKETVHLRLEAVGPVIYEGATPVRHLFRWDFALKASGVDTWSDEDGIWAIPLTFTPVHDADWGHATQITVRNTVAAL